MDELATYLAAWRESCDRALALCLELDPDDWDRPTDLPGWTVRDVLAHLAHIETVLADGDPDADESSAGGREVSPEWTHRGVEARRGTSPEELRAELSDAVLRRAGTLAEELQPDPHGRPDVTPAGLEWDWATLLRNRALDVWVHEQDIRRAVDRPGGMSGGGAEVTVHTFAAALPYVLGKKVAPPPGTTVAWSVQGPVPLERVLQVDDARRAVRAPEGTKPDARMRMDTETFAMLVAGRRGWDGVRLEVDGDEALGRQVVDAMGVTP